MINKIPQAIFGCRSASTKRSHTTLFLSDSYSSEKYKFHMGVSKNRGIPKSSHFNRVFHYKPSILGFFPLFLVQHPYIPVASASASPGCQVVLHKATAIDAKAITSTQGTQNCVPPNAVSHILRELELAYSPLEYKKKTSKEKCLVAHTNSTVVSTSYCYQCASCCFEEVCSDADSAH